MVDTFYFFGYSLFYMKPYRLPVRWKFDGSTRNWLNCTMIFNIRRFSFRSLFFQYIFFGIQFNATTFSISTLSSGFFCINFGLSLLYIQSNSYEWCCRTLYNSICVQCYTWDTFWWNISVTYFVLFLRSKYVIRSCLLSEGDGRTWKLKKKM